MFLKKCFGCIVVLLCIGMKLPAALINVPADQPTIQDGINAAVSGIDEVVVAPGTYPEGINFLGKSITVRSASGDPNDTIIAPPANQHGVRFVSGEDPNAVLKDLTVTGADLSGLSFPNNRGGGIYIIASAPTITRCIISNNQNIQAGGGIAIVDNSSPAITDCIIDGNLMASNGAGIYCADSTVTLDGCTISHNQTGIAGFGGGMYDTNSEVIVTQCAFIDNQSGAIAAVNGRGGGIYNLNSSLTVSHSSFTGNIAFLSIGGGIYHYNTVPRALTLSDSDFINNDAQAGGGVHTESTDKVVVWNCNFTGNTGGDNAGGLFLSSAHSGTSVSQCTFSNNTIAAASNGGGLYINKGAVPVQGCLFSNNLATLGGGLYTSSVDGPSIVDCQFIGNTANIHGGGIYNSGILGMVKNCIFDQNSAVNLGGGIYNDGSGTTISEVTFTGNSADFGGGIYNLNSDGLSLTQAMFSGNAATTEGGGIYNASSDIAMLHCTLGHNSAGNGGGMFDNNSSSTITNSIIALNDPNGLVNSGGISTITYSNIQGGFAGAGNIDSDPLFIDADGADNVMGTADDDLRLQSISTSSDAGDSTVTGAAGVTTDLDGNSRGADNPAVTNTGISTLGANIVVDMGAYEVQNPCTNAVEGDINCDGMVNIFDFLLMAGNWLAGT